jgi:hypothetical protein
MLHRGSTSWQSKATGSESAVSLMSQDRSLLERLSWIASIASAALAFYLWFAQSERSQATGGMSRFPAPGYPTEVAPLPPTHESKISQARSYSPLVAPSFNCRKATYHSEMLICASSDLAALDLALADAYRHAKAIAGTRGKAALRDEENYWLRRIRDQCPDVACLTSTYESRIAELRARSR